MCSWPNLFLLKTSIKLKLTMLKVSRNSRMKIIFSGYEEEGKVSNEIQWFTNIHLLLSEDQDWV